MDSSDKEENVKKTINLRLNYFDVKTLELNCDFKSEKLEALLEKIKSSSSANEQKFFLDEVRSIINEIFGREPS